MPINIIYDSSSPSFHLNAQTPICLDWTQTPFDARVGVVIADGSTASYSVEYCLDNVNDASLSASWFTDPTLNQWQTASGVTSYSSPIQFTRVNIQSLSGSLSLKVLQGLPT